MLCCAVLQADWLMCKLQLCKSCAATLQGMYKSTLVCPECDHCSVKFDPAVSECVCSSDLVFVTLQQAVISLQRHIDIGRQNAFSPANTHPHPPGPTI